MPNPLQRGMAVVRENERVVMIMVSTTLVMSGQGIVTPVLPLFALAFGATAAAVGLTLSIFALARLILNVPLGILADRFGRRIQLVAGPLVSALGMAGSGIAADISELLIWRFVAGAGSAMYMTAAQIYLADISDTRNRARVIGTNQAALLFGVTIGPGIGGLLADLYGFRVPFFVVGGAALVAGGYAWARLPETRPPRSADPGQARVRARGSWRRLLGSRDFLAVSSVTASVFLSRAAGRMTLMPLLAASAHGYSAGALGALFMAMATVNLIGIAPASILADRFGRKWAIVPSFALMAGAFLLMATSTSHAGFLISAGLLALGTAVVGPAPAAYTADISPPELYGLSMGLYRTAGDAGFVLGPLLLGALADLTSIGWALAANGIIVAAAALFFGVAARETVGVTSRGYEADPVA